MDNSLSAPAIRQMFLDFFTEKVGQGRVVVGVGWALDKLHGCEHCNALSLIWAKWYETVGLVY